MKLASLHDSARRQGSSRSLRPAARAPHPLAASGSSLLRHTTRLGPKPARRGRQAPAAQQPIAFMEQKEARARSPERNLPPTSLEEACSLPACLPLLAARHGARVALNDIHFHPPTKLTYEELGNDVSSFAAGMLELGVQPGDNVALFSENSHRWCVADLGLQSAGCVPCVRGGTTGTPEELCYILGRGSDATAAVVQDPQTALKLKAYFAAPGATGGNEFVDSLSGRRGGGVRAVVVLRDWEGQNLDKISKEALGGIPLVPYTEVLERGRASPPAQLRAARAAAALTLDSPATISYTSGTTGLPKGVVLTQGNLLSQVRGFPDFVKVEPGDAILSMLPPWHVYERSSFYYVLLSGALITYSNVKRLALDLPRGCDFLITVPLVLDTLHQRIMTSIAKSGAVRRAVAGFLIGAAVAAVRHKRTLEGCDVEALPVPTGPGLGNWFAAAARWVTAVIMSVLLRPLAALADRLAFAKVRSGLGVRKGVISGGGSLQLHLDDFYEAAGISVINGWGMTESAPVITCRSQRPFPGANVRGTVGRPIRDTELRVVDPEDPSRDLPPGTKGMLLARGPGVMRGYYRDEQATARAFRVGDSWLDTGDLGLVIPASPRHSMGGCVMLTGRAKDTIVLRGGENVEPQPLEDAALCSPLIKQVVVVGQDRRHLGALVVPDWEYVGSLAEERGLAEGFSEAQVSDMVYKEIDRLTRNAPGWQPHHKVVNIGLLKEVFSPEDGTLTRTMKVRRNAVSDKYRAQIEKLFQGH